MNSQFPRKVLITGGREVGGVGSFAEGLREGFSELGILAEVISPSQLLSHWRDLRDSSVLKILSTTAMFASPLARRAICMSHGVPCVAHQGWARTLAILASYKLANICSGTQLVAVSDYTAVHMHTIFNLKVDAVIRNPLQSLFLESFEDKPEERTYITYVGRLHRAKNMHRLMPAFVEIVNETPGLRACIIGDGELRAELERSVKGDARFEFTGSIDSRTVRDRLRRTRLFVSGSPTEPFGISYLEALSQGCTVAMPACGGGLEIALEQIGKRVQLLPISLGRNEVVSVFRRALIPHNAPCLLSAYDARAVASAYIAVDASRSSEAGECVLEKLYKDTARVE